MSDAKEPTTGVYFLIWFILLLIGVGTGIVTWTYANKAWKKDAVDQGHAEWYIQDHKKEWRWKETIKVTE